MWDELEYYTTNHPSCVGFTTYKKHVEIQVFDFLAGLNSEYEQVRV